MRIDLPKLRAWAKGRPCRRCRVNDGTTVWAHYTGPMQHRLGKGKGIKCHDHVGCELCRRCHDYIDQSPSKDVRSSEELLTLCLLALADAFNEGVLRES